MSDISTVSDGDLEQKVHAVDNKASHFKEGEKLIIKQGLKRNVSFSIQEPGSATSSDCHTPNTDEADYEFSQWKKKESDK